MKALERLSVTFIVGALVLGRVIAQEHPQTTAGGIPLAEIPAPPPLDMRTLTQAEAPEIGNWASVALEIPIYPFNPYSGLTNVPVYLLRPADRKGGLPFMAFDDRAIETVRALERAAMEAAQEQEAKLGSSSAKPGGKGEADAPVALSKGLVPLPDALQLDIEEVDLSNRTVLLVVLNATDDTNPPPWDVWLSSPLGTAPDQWTWISSASAGQTNLTVRLPSDTESYFRLGATNNDVDADGILDRWMSQHFNCVIASADSRTLGTNDFDGDSHDNLWSYTNGASPNILRGRVQFPSLYVIH